MCLKLICRILICSFAFCASGTLFAQVPTVDEIRADFGKSNYRDAMLKINRLLAQSNQEPLPPVKYEMLMMRGECQLQLKDRLGAATSFKSAAKCAADVNQLSMAKADALIAERSAMGKFTPRLGATKDAIDIVPMDSRREAMKAYQAELWSQNKTQFDSALSATTLPPIEKVFIPLSNVFFLEMAATNDAPETGKVMRELGAHTYDLMHSEITRYATRIDFLTQAANSSTGSDGNWGGVRRGLFSNERDELKDAGAYLIKLRDRATEYRAVAGKLGGNEQKWDGLMLDINDTIAAADALFNDQ